MGSSLSDEVQGWEQLQPRILVLASLLIQCFLFISAPMRKRQIPGLLRVFIWLAYLGSDAVALYALTTLVSRQEKGSKAGPQVFWVPILLVHLGGQEAITAYNIEDNERWRDHVQTAVLKISVAINVFVKNYPWSSSDVGIFVTGVLLLLCGITKCVCKPWDLKRVSINSLRPDSTAPAEEGEINSLHEYVRAAAQCVQEQADHGRSGVQPSDGICKVHDVWKTYNLRADVAPLYSGRLSCLKHLVHINPDEAHRLVQSGLSATFDRLYTKESLKLHDASSLNLTSNAALNRWKVLTSAVGIRSVAAAVLLWVTVLFFNRDPDSNDKPADVAITRALLFCALVMECVVPLGFDSFDRIKQWRLNANRWPDQVAQYNLVGYLARNKKHSWLMKMATCLVGADLLDQLWCMRSSKSSHQITRLVHGHVARAWTEGHVGDAEAFRAFNDCRGQWTLDRDDTLISTSKHLRAGVSRPFDESVLLWHLATDFCFFRRGPPSCEAAGRCREMSNYMAYLLFVKPEMMMAGARRCLFRDAYGELVRILRENAHPHAGRDERGLANKVMQVVKGDRQGSSVVHQAWRMADDLMALHGGNEQGMWAVVQGVWVEMLCFSAGRCTGYLHLKSLGTGGEYMSYVWLLLLYMGMETLSEKMQRTELYEAATCRTSAAATAAFNDHNV